MMIHETAGLEQNLQSETRKVFFANNFENYHIIGTIFIISQYFALVEQIFFCIFIKNLILLSAMDVARNGTIEKCHEEM